MKLYEYDEILETLYRVGKDGELVDPDTGLVYDITLIDKFEMERSAKIENSLLYAEQLKADASEIDAYIKRLTERSRAKKNAADSIKNYVLGSMQNAHESKFETIRIRATVRIVVENKTLITDERLIPSQFFRTKIEPDTAAIRAAIKAGENVPGAKLIDSVSLTVK